jgi:hypothetical protein
MKFSILKVFRGDGTAEDVIRYLSVELANSLKDLSIGLNKLKLTENFEGFEATFSFSGNDEQSFRHNVGFIPSQRIILRSSSADICDGDTAWSKDYVYMKKTSAGAGTAKVIFLR